jgi:hypothetical protein
MKKLDNQMFKQLVSEIAEKKSKKDHKKSKDKNGDVHLRSQTSNYDIGDILSSQLILKDKKTKSKYTIGRIDYDAREVIAYTAKLDDSDQVVLNPTTGKPEMVAVPIKFDDISKYVVA